MSLSVSARGTGTHNSSTTTFTLSPSGSFAAGSMAVLVVSADNAHASGTAFTTFAVSDDAANVWTRQVTPLYDPGAASEGVTGAQFTCDMAGATLTSSTVITVTFDTATTAKTWALWEVIPAVNKVVSIIASGVNAGAATTTPTVTTSSITSGDVVIGGLHNEYGTAQTITQDGDATNGAWSSQQTTEVGTTTTGQSVSSQYKITTGTATQTYNPTLGTSSDVILSWLQLRESPFVQVGAVDQSAYVLLDSMSLKFNTFDFALKNPATTPALDDAVTLGLPTWSGTVASVTTTDLRVDYKLVTITATNTDVAAASAGPFGLSDTPNGTTTFPFQGMSVKTTTNLDASVETTCSCTIFRAGLWPAMTFELTSANRGYSAQSFTARDVTVTWPLKTNPTFRVEFGDPIVTMSVWVASKAADAPDGSISGTKITDLSVTTPKLAANAVTTAKLDADAIIANVLNAGGTVTIDSTGITITDGALTFEDEFGATALDGGGFGPTWRRYITSGVYNSDFAALPPTPGSNINNSTNILPSWSWTVVSGSAISVKSNADGSAPSGRSLTFTMASGAANDEAYIQQIVPINGSIAQTYIYFPSVTAYSQTGSNSIGIYLEGRYLEADGTTTVGPSGSLLKTLNEIGAGPLTFQAVLNGGTGSMPSTAYYLRLRVGMHRNGAATGATGTVKITEVTVAGDDEFVVIPDATTPDSSWGLISLDSSILNIGVAGTSSPAVRLYAAGASAKIGLWGLIVAVDTSFPSSPATNDLYYRTDLDQWFYYDGTRWLSVTLYTDAIGVTLGSLPIAASTTIHQMALPRMAASSSWLESFYSSFYVTGGTALSASHKWVLTLVGWPSNTLLATGNINSGASDVWREITAVTINTVSSDYLVQMTSTKTGTPGDLQALPRLQHRLIAT